MDGTAWLYQTLKTMVFSIAIFSSLSPLISLEICWYLLSYIPCTQDDQIHQCLPIAGEMIQRFKDDRLREVAGDICNIKGVLYLPCWEKGKFLTFRLH